MFLVGIKYNDMKSEIRSITVITGDYPSKGRMDYVFVQQLVHTIIDMGIKITVVAPQSIVHKIVHRKGFLPRYSQGVTEKGNVYDIYRPYTLTFGNKDYFSRFTRWYNKRAILSVVKKIDSEVLYSHFWSSALPVYEYAIDNKRPLFVACGEGDDALEDMVAAMSDEDIKYLSSAVTGVVSVSSENKRKCIAFGLASEDNVDVFPNCVNTSIFHKMDVPEMKKQLGITENDFVIGFAGGFIPRKGPDRIARAIAKLNDPQIKVMFIGKPFSGYDYDFDCPGIIHKGPLEHDLLPKYLNCADVFVMPTQKEGCCNAIVESLAMGLPVISSDGAFNDDILDKNNSIRINPDDVDAIAAAIKTLKEDVVLKKQMSEYSLSRHKEYTIEGRAKRIIEFVEKQIKKKFSRY